MIMAAKPVCIKDKDMPCKKARQLYRTFLLKYLSIVFAYLHCHRVNDLQKLRSIVSKGHLDKLAVQCGLP